MNRGKRRHYQRQRQLQCLVCRDHQNEQFSMMTAAQMTVQTMTWLGQCHTGHLHLPRQMFSHHAYLLHIDDFMCWDLQWEVNMFVVQGIGRLFRCLCNPAYDVDDDFEPRKWVLKKQAPVDEVCVFCQTYDSEQFEFGSYLAILSLKDTHVDATSALVIRPTVQRSSIPHFLSHEQ